MADKSEFIILIENLLKEDNKSFLKDRIKNLKNEMEKVYAKIFESISFYKVAEIESLNDSDNQSQFSQLSKSLDLIWHKSFQKNVLGPQILDWYKPKMVQFFEKLKNRQQ